MRNREEWYKGGRKEDKGKVEKRKERKKEEKRGEGRRGGEKVRQKGLRCALNRIGRRVTCLPVSWHSLEVAGSLAGWSPWCQVTQNLAEG